MRELPFERAFREWVEGAGHRWDRLRYARPEADGETTAYRLSPARPPRGVVLAAHGAGNDALFALVGTFRALLERGYEVFTFDLDGQGRGSTTRLTPDAIRSSVPAAVGQSGAGERGLPLHAIGISFGGSVLLGSLPSLRPAPASAALLVAPLQVRFSRRAVAREVGWGLLRTVWRERGHYGLTGLIPSFGPFKRGAYPLRLGTERGPGAFGYVVSLNRILDSLALEEAARRTSTPTLLVYGGRDLLVPAEQGERLAELLPASELLTLPRETHLTAPLAPAAVERLLRWIEEHGSA